jgi:hypothetical protein
MPLTLGGMTALVLVVASLAVPSIPSIRTILNTIMDVRRDENETGCFDVLGPCFVALEVSGRLGVSAGSVAMDVSTFSRISARRKVPPVPQRGKYLEIKTESVARLMKRKVPQGNKEESASR